MSARLPTAAFAVLALAAAALPAVALAKFTSAPTAIATLSSGPLPPIEATTGNCVKNEKFTVSWTRPSGFQPRNYTVWWKGSENEAYKVAATVSGAESSYVMSSPARDYYMAVSASYGSWQSALAQAPLIKC
jgi:hypothetical protein